MVIIIRGISFNYVLIDLNRIQGRVIRPFAEDRIVVEVSFCIVLDGIAINLSNSASTTWIRISDTIPVVTTITILDGVVVETVFIL